MNEHNVIGGGTPIHRSASGGDARRTCILVLGMHRSGTSAFTRVMSLLGAALPANLLGADRGNERGHWEPERLFRLHDRLLAATGSRWDDWRALDLGRLSANGLAEYRRELVELLESEYASSALFAIKEPRICRFAPMFGRQLGEMGIDARFVLPVRNPLAVVASLHARDGLTEGHSALLWLRYVLDAEAATRDTARAIVSYEALLADWRSAIGTISSRLGMRWPVSTDRAAPEVDSFLSSELQHFAPSRRELMGRADIPAWIKDAYDALLRLERDSEDEAALAALDRTRGEFEAACPAFGTAMFAELGAREARHLEALRHAGQHTEALRSAIAVREGDIAGLRAEIAARDRDIDALRETVQARAGEAETLTLTLSARDAEIRSFQEALETKEGELAGQRALIEARDREVQLLKSNISVCEAEIAALQSMAGSTKDEVADLRKQLHEQAGQSHQLGSTTSEAPRDGASRCGFDARKMDWRRPDAGLDSQVVALRNELAAPRAELDEARSQLDLVYASRSWRITRPLRLGNAALSELYRWTRRTRRFVPRLQPMNEPVEVAARSYRSTGPGPQFQLIFPRGRVPEGLCQVFYAAGPNSEPVAPRLYFDVGAGFRERDAIQLPAARDRLVCFTLIVPAGVARMRLDPTDRPRSFTLARLEFRQVGRIRAAWTLLRPRLARALSRPWELPHNTAVVARKVREGGLASVKALLLNDQKSLDYGLWIDTYATVSAEDRAAMSARIEAMSHRPLISVVMPTYNTPEAWLRRAIDSVRTQIYPHWELCIADDASADQRVGEILRASVRQDERIKVTFRGRNGHISAATNSALELATGEFVALLDHDDELTPDALFWVAAEVLEHPGAELIYTDQDKIDAGGRRVDPYFKPDWNYDLMLSHNKVGHLAVYRTERLRGIGGLREGYEGAQDYDLALRFTDGLGDHQIRHIPRVLYHWRAHGQSTACAKEAKSYAYEAAERAITAHLLHSGIGATVMPAPEAPGMHRVRYELPAEPPSVTLIIPTRNRLGLLRACIGSLLQNTDYPSYDVIIVDNGSDDPATLEYLCEIASERTVRVLRDGRPFNFSALNNAAVREARGEVVGLLNNDVEVIDADWLREMVSHAVRPRIGAVGARLWYPDYTLQHGGVVLGVGGVAGHSHKRMPRGQHGYFGRAVLISDFSAVTAACLVIRKSIYEEVGGLDESLTVAFNDVDFCLRVRDRGYRNLWTPYAELIHHESKSRGAESTPDKRERFAGEIDVMKRRWGDRLLNDPAYNPNLSLEREGFGLAWPPRVRSVVERLSMA